MGDKKLDRFGKYLLLDHLLDGGMNRIFRARYLGDTASKICAVKVVLPQYSNDPQFKIMFMDEIKVTFGLLHPNIVQTYDYGTHKGQLYVAMEYCDGRNLKEYLDKLKERKFVFPVEISVYIGTQICQGLHYAHTLTDKLSGKEMNIIHRDISPHNIMLTYDGGIKIIDFGIAKAETNSEATQAGTIKGKLSYLAPEYLEGSDLDARYDQFAVGITLWEMLCNRKLFKAPNDIAVLKKIQECNIPKPSSINPNVPLELDEIILKSLSKKPENRFENMDMLNRALIKFLYSKYPDFNATDLSYFAKELFKEDIQKDREKLFDYGKIDLAPYINDMKAEDRGEVDSDNTLQTSVKNEKSNIENVDLTKPRANAVFDFGFSGEKDERTKTGTRILNRKKVKKALGGNNSIPTINTSFNKKSDEPKLNIEVKTENNLTNLNTRRAQSFAKNEANNSINKSRVVKLSNEKGVTSKPSNSKFKIAVGSLLVLIGVGFFFQKNIDSEKHPRSMASNLEDNDSNNNNVEKNDVDEKKEVLFGKLEIINFDKYNQQLFLNGIKYEVDVLGSVGEVPYGDYYLRVEEDGYKNFIELISINLNNSNLKIKLPKLEPGKFGYLEVSQNCFRGEIEFVLFGEKRKEEIPFRNRNNLKFPVDEDQMYTLFYSSKEDDSLKKKIEFSIKKENDVIDFCQLLLE